MNPVQISDWGDFPATRFIGELIRAEILRALETESLVVVDFANVSSVGPSFADECFGVLFSENGPDFIKTRLSLVNLSSEVRAMIRFVLAERNARQIA